jgi:TRAP transporter TAXI family solute receptor
MKLFSKSLIVAAAVAAVGAAAPASAENVRLMTGPQGGSWVPLGGQLKDMWEKAIPGLAVQALPGAGIANVRGVQDGKTEIGFGNSISTVDALAGNAPFNTPHKNVCNIATLYPQYFQVIVPADAGINSIKDLKGKSISTQPRGNTGEQIARDILKVNGLNYESVKTSFVSYTDSVTLMKDGHAQAFMLGTTIPAGAIMDVAASRDIKLLDLSANLNDMRKINPGYTLINVPAGTYPKQAKDVKVIGYATHIVASCKLPEKMVYEMTKTMAANVDTMAAVVKAAKGLTVKVMGQDIGVPFHAGAAKFYKEKGVSVKTM